MAIKEPTWTYKSKGDKQTASEMNELAQAVIINATELSNAKDYVANLSNNATSLDNRITAIEESGPINQADGDDLENIMINGTPVIREKTTKTYRPDKYSGMGRVILRKNIVNGVNVLTQDVITQSNTIYEIRYDFDLNGEEITVPKDCVLDFQGGSISNGTIIGNSTSIKAGALKIFGAEITITNVWNIAEAYPEWFGAVGDGVTDDYDAFRKCISLGGKIKLLAKEYYIEGQFVINNSVSIIGEGSNEELSPSILSFGVPNSLAAITIDANVTYYTTGTPLVIRDCIIQPKNWTVHEGMGLDICRTIYMKNVVVQKFKRTNLFLHHDNTQEGPYNSVFEQCKFCFSGEHGAVVGRGANSLTFIYCTFHWNGAPAYGQYVSSQGDYDGLLITSKDSYIPNVYSYADNSFYPSFTVQAINLIGGSACHNSRYGYNISNLEDSNFVNLGYAERNYAGLGQTASQDTHQIYIGNGCRNCSFFINYVLMQALDTFAFEHRFSVRICFLGKIYEGRYKQLMSGTLTDVATKVLASATNVDVTREITSSGYVEKATCSNGKSYVKQINDYREAIIGLENTITGHILNAIDNSLEVFYTVDSSHPISTLNNYFQTVDYKRYKIRKCNLGNSATTLTLGTDKIIDVSFGTIKNGKIDLNGAKIVPDYNSLINSSLTILGFPGEGTIYYQNGKLTWSNGSRWNEADGAKAGVVRSGVSADRPAGNYIYVGFKFFDIELGKPIYASVIDYSSPYTVTWVDSTGATV